MKGGGYHIRNLGKLTETFLGTAIRGHVQTTWANVGAGVVQMTTIEEGWSKYPKIRST